VADRPGVRWVCHRSRQLLVAGPSVDEIDGRPAETPGRCRAGRLFDIDAVSGSVTPTRIPVPDPYAPARSPCRGRPKLGCSTSVIYHWIRTGQLTARRGFRQPVLHPLTSRSIAGCQRRIEHLGHLNPAARRTKPASDAEAARECRRTCHARITSSADAGLTSTLRTDPEHPDTWLQ